MTAAVSALLQMTRRAHGRKKTGSSEPVFSAEPQAQ